MKDAQNKKPAEEIFFAYHQLRTPLISSKWIAEMLLKGEAGTINPEQESLLKDLYSAIGHANRLVGHLLSTARIDSGELHVKPESVDLERVYSDVIKEFQPMIVKKSHTLVFKKPKDLPRVNTDPRYLQEILDNLISNSIKYTPDKGKIELSINAEKSFFLFTVKDNGMGIPKAQQKKIFNKFFRADNAVQKSNDGTGLGLYIVNGLAKSLGGKIWFESSENKGTTFYFRLPIKY